MHGPFPPADGAICGHNFADFAGAVAAGSKLTLEISMIILTNKTLEIPRPAATSTESVSSHFDVAKSPSRSSDDSGKNG